MIRRPVRLLIVCALAWMTCPLSADEGAKVVIGGALEPGNAAIYHTILDLRLDGRPICILPTASAEPKKSMKSYLDDFLRWGGKGAAITIPISSGDLRRASSSEMVKKLGRCGGFFFTGGDQSRIVDTLRSNGISSPAGKAIRGAVASGAVISGTSAGAAAMSDPMIGGGTSSEALQFGVVRQDGEPGVWIRDGMGWLDDVLVDQHCLARGRLGRLLAALREEDGKRLGACVDEDTAMVVRDEQAEIVGVSGVAFLDVSGDSARLWLLGEGDRLDLEKRSAVPSDRKKPQALTTPAPAAPEDPWEDDVLHRFLIDFGLSATAEVDLTTQWTLRKGEEFRILSGEDMQPFAGPFEILVKKESY